MNTTAYITGTGFKQRIKKGALRRKMTYQFSTKRFIFFHFSLVKIFQFWKIPSLYLQHKSSSHIFLIANLQLKMFSWKNGYFVYPRSGQKFWTRVQGRIKPISIKSQKNSLSKYIIKIYTTLHVRMYHVRRMFIAFFASPHPPSREIGMHEEWGRTGIERNTHGCFHLWSWLFKSRSINIK